MSWARATCGPNRAQAVPQKRTLLRVKRGMIFPEGVRLLVVSGRKCDAVSVEAIIGRRGLSRTLRRAQTASADSLTRNNGWRRETLAAPGQEPVALSRVPRWRAGAHPGRKMMRGWCEVKRNETKPTPFTLLNA